MTRVGFVGLGNIGRPMALRLAASAHDLVVYDVAPDPVAELVAAGARSAGSVSELAAEVEVLCVMVRDDDQVRQVLAETAGADGLVAAIHSTVAPQTPAELADVAASHGVAVIDAPVSGGTMGASAGSLAFMVGGPAGAFATAAPVLETMGALVVHAGPIGSGTRMKLARNLMHFIAFTAATEAQRLAEAAGLDLVELGKVVRHTDAITGGPGAMMYRATTTAMAPDDPWVPIFEHAVTLGEKDLGFATALADELGVDVPLGRLALSGLRPGLGLAPKETS